MEELWKDIPGYEGYYQVSTFGNIKSLERLRKNHSKFTSIKEKILNPTVNKNGYKMIMLCKNATKKRVYLHRIVAQTFIVNPNDYSIVNHIDGNKLNNNINNLEWVTSKYNNIHAIRNNLRGYRYGKNNNNSKIIYQIDKNTNKIISKFYGSGEIKREYNFSPSSILKCCEKHKKHKTAYGYKWAYEEDYKNE